MIDLTDTISLAYILVGLIIVLFAILFMGSSCGGRDACGKKWCFIGIVEDYKGFVFYAVIISIILDIVLILFHIIEQ